MNLEPRTVKCRSAAGRINENPQCEVLASLLEQTHARHERLMREVGREIHDEIAQKLSSIAISLGTAADDALNPELKAALPLVHDLIKSVRSLSKKVYPKLIETFGFAAALEWLLQNSLTNQRPPLKLSLQEVHLPHPVAICLYRACEEIIESFDRYSPGRPLRVRLSSTARLVRLSFYIPAAPMSEQQRCSSFGLVSAAQRVLSLGGIMEVHTISRRGTRVSLSIPTTRSGQQNSSLCSELSLQTITS